MRQTEKLYKILEKAEIDTKIGVEIQDWILDTIDERRDLAMNQFRETALTPLNTEMRLGFNAMNQRFETLQSDMEKRFSYVDQRFENLEEKIDARFQSLEKRLDTTNFTIRILGVPIVGSTIGGLGIIFLQIYERLLSN